MYQVQSQKELWGCRRQPRASWQCDENECDQDAGARVAVVDRATAGALYIHHRHQKGSKKVQSSIKVIKVKSIVVIYIFAGERQRPVHETAIRKEGRK